MHRTLLERKFFLAVTLRCDRLKQCGRRYIAEVDRLKAEGRVSEQNHEVLRLSLNAPEELMEVTRGEIDGITENNLRTILTRLEQDYAADKEERLRQERLSHEETMKALAASEREKAETARREQTLMEQGVVHKEELTKLRDFEADATSRKRKKVCTYQLICREVC